MDERPALLAVATAAPWPPADGYALRVVHLLRELGRTWKVVLVAPPAGPGWEPERWGVATFVPVTLGGTWRLPSQYDPRPLAAATDPAVAGFRPRAALLWGGAEHLAFRPGFPPAVADRIDCMALVAWRGFRAARGLRERLRALSDAWAYARYERRVVRRLPATVVVGEDDARALRRLAGLRAGGEVPPGAGLGPGSVHVVPNGVALPRAEVKREGPRPTVIFSGVMAYRPNAEAVRWFAREVWPLVRAEVPAARFAIAGRGVTPEVARLAEGPGVEVLGPVPDMTAALGEAWVAVAPMRSGAGIKNKVLEAWAAGTPVVMTRLAGNGLALDAEAEELVRDDPAEMARLLVRLLGDAGARARYGRAARALVASRHAWSAAGERLSRLLADAGASG